MRTRKRGNLKQFLDWILEWIFPSTCGVCGKISADSSCKKCEIKLRKLEVCKKQIKIRQEEDYTLFYIFSYTGIIREKLLEFKFKDHAYLAKMFVKILLGNEKICRFLKSYDIIIPVPAYPTKKWERGYNQTECIIRELGKKDQKWKYDFRNFKESEKYKKTKFFKKRRSKNQFTKCI